MYWGMLGIWDWILIELAVLGLLIAELISVNRTIRRSKVAERAADSADPQA
jgi:hypothetical protein